jgi:hypothetical protein
MTQPAAGRTSGAKAATVVAIGALAIIGLIAILPGLLFALSYVIADLTTAQCTDAERAAFEEIEHYVPIEARNEYGRALDLYENAKTFADRAEKPEDLKPVTHALEEGRWLLGCVSARVSGEPLPDRRAVGRGPALDPPGPPRHPRLMP